MVKRDELEITGICEECGALLGNTHLHARWHKDLEAALGHDTQAGTKAKDTFTGRRGPRDA
jgi:hypothetical protein